MTYPFYTISYLESLDHGPVQVASTPLIVYVNGTPAITVGDIPNWEEKCLRTGSQSKSMASKQKRDNVIPSTKHKAKVIKALGKLERANFKRRGHPRLAPITLASPTLSDAESLQTSEVVAIPDDSAHHAKRARIAVRSPSTATLYPEECQHQQNSSSSHQPSGSQTPHTLIESNNKQGEVSTCDKA